MRRLLILSIAASFVTIPLLVKVHNGFMLLSTALAVSYYAKHSLKPDWKVFLLYASLFLLSGFSMLYTSAVEQGLLRLETKLPALLWPFILLYNRSFKLEKKEVDYFFYAFSIMIVLCCLYCHWQMFVNLRAMEMEPKSLLTFYQFQTSYLAQPIKAHPTYLSLYIAISIFSFVFYLVHRNHRPASIAVHSILIAYLLLFLFLLASRAAIGAFILVVICSGCFVLFFQRKKRFGIIIISTVLLLFLVSFALVSNIRYKFYDTIHNFISYSSHVESENSVTFHFRSWVCSLEQITASNIVFGVGLGDDKYVLKQCYLAHNWKTMYEKEFNSHNHYLTILLQLGLVGLFSFIALIVFSARLAFVKRDFFMLMIMLLFCICFFGESLLEMQKGVTSFYLFLCALSNRNM